MGPQLDSCGRSSDAEEDAVGGAQLQWGRNLTVAEGAPPAAKRGPPALLQWGRNLTVAEGPPRPRRRGPGPASMGPQLDSCGRGEAGAAVIHLRTLQWGRNLTVAEGPAHDAKAPDTLDASMGPQLDSCGRLCVRHALRHPVRASMGPQLDSCGRRQAEAAGRNHPRHASMGPQLDSCGRKGGLADMIAAMRSFNGAAT